MLLSLLLGLSIGVPAGFWLASLVAILVAWKRMALLADEPIDQRRDTSWPLISVVIPACNEQETIATTLRAALASGYPALQIVAVDDRSDDATGARIEAVAARDLRVVAVHVDELPHGWLGKLNAMQRGLERAQGEWVLFADADAELAEGTLERAISYADRRGVDFLSALPEVRSAGFLGDCVFNAATVLLPLTTRPWSIKDPRSSAIAASGAFLLVRRRTLDGGPGLTWLKQEVADDFGMSLLIKTHGGTSDLVLGEGAVALTWYTSFREMAAKMQKNFFAITGRFSLARIVLQALLLAYLALFPLLALLALGQPSAQWIVGLGLAGFGLQLTAMVVGSIWSARPLLPALFPPLGLLLTAIIALRAGIIGKRIGGIRWRGVLYRSEDLASKQRVKL